LPTTTPIQAKPGIARSAGRRTEQRTRAPTARVQQHAIEGRYRPITTTQLVLSWWLYSSKQITKRQLRICFCAHELAERRSYTSSDRKGCADYTLKEIKALVGGRGSATADRDLSADIKRLSEIGLVKIAKRSITFAETVEQIATDHTAGFYLMWDQMDQRTRSRSVSVPRRTLRALAGGFTTGATAYMIAALIRCVFWRRSERCFNTDGRVRDAWVAEAFGLGLTTVRSGRRELTRLGVIEKKADTPQWLLNKYGNHIIVHCGWTQSAGEELAAPEAVENPDPMVGEGTPKSDTPPGPKSAKSDTPCLDRSALSTRDSTTRRLGVRTPDPAGVSIETKLGGRKRATGRPRRPTPPAAAPSIRDIKPHDLASTERLFDLHKQFVAEGLAKGGRAGELDFLSLANRARVRGHNPGGLLRRLLEQNRTGWITMADEEVASRRMREHFEGAEQSCDQNERTRSIQALIQPRRIPGTSRHESRLSPEGEFVEKCIRVAKQAGLQEKRWWQVAQSVKQWTHDQWEAAYCHYQLEQVRHWHGDELEEAYG
jgi:hypothetical protein